MLILASASPRRLELLAQIGIVPDAVIPAEIDESMLKNEQPPVYVQRMAREKYAAIQQDGARIIAADTIVALGRRVLGKPKDEAQARQFLTLLSGRRHRVYSAVCIDGRVKLVMTAVKFKRLTEAEINAYITSGEWQGKAGGYAIQGRAEAFIPWINGSYSNVVGLPLTETALLFKQPLIHTCFNHR